MAAISSSKRNELNISTSTQRELVNHQQRAAELKASTRHTQERGRQATAHSQQTIQTTQIKPRTKDQNINRQHRHQPHSPFLSEALSVHNARAALVILILGDPHFLERAQRRQNGPRQSTPSICARAAPRSSP